MLWNRRKVPIYEWDKRWFPDLSLVTAPPAATILSWTAPDDCYRTLVSVLVRFQCDTSIPIRRFTLYSSRGSVRTCATSGRFYLHFDGLRHICWANGNPSYLEYDYPDYTLNCGLPTHWHILPGDVLTCLCHTPVLTDHFVDMAITCEAWYL